jgi:hypothetical protein
MKIRKCSGCAELVHFNALSKTQWCWNCGARVNATSPPTLADRTLHLASERTQNVTFGFSLPLVWKKVALLSALPIAATMLLVCNSLDIYIVRVATVPFEVLPDHFGW